MSDTENENENETPAVPDDDAPITEEQVQEAENEPDTAAPEDAVPVAPTEATPSTNDREMDRAIRSLEKEAERHGKRVSEIMGEDFPTLAVCPLCAPAIPGFRWPIVPSVDVVNAVKEAIGEPAIPPLKRDKYSRRCDVCDGYGATDTDSRVSGQNKVQCLDCGGKGWVAVGPERLSGAVLAPNGVIPAVNYGADKPPTSEPPEAEALRSLGYIVVSPITPIPSNAGS